LFRKTGNTDPIPSRAWIDFMMIFSWHACCFMGLGCRCTRSSASAQEGKDMTTKSVRSREPNEAPVDDRQLLEAIVLQLVQYRAACRRFNQRRRAMGLDYDCRKLLDQIALRKSLLQLLAREARQRGPVAA
jgi:hypothetical protein